MSDNQPTIRFSTQIGYAGRAQVSRETPFRILLMGDFSGAAHGDSQGYVPLTHRRPVLIDVDNVAEVMQRLRSSVLLPADVADNTPLPLREIEDFHPDVWVTRVRQFDRLRSLRDALFDVSSFDRAAEEVGAWASWREEARDSEKTAEKTETRQPAPLFGIPENLLEQTLEATQPAAEVVADSDTSLWTAAIRDLVRPYAVPGMPPKQAELVECVDQATSLLMNALLHTPAVQRLEAAWRGVQFLLRRLPLGTQLKLYLLDVTKQELAADLTSGATWTETALHKLMVEETVGTAGGHPWAVVGGLYQFGATAEDATLLSHIARLTRHAGAAFVSDAAPQLVGCSSFAQTPDPRDWQGAMNAEAESAWQVLRRSPEAQHVCLAAPRVLLRLPYGADTSPVEAFAYEEMPHGPAHDQYLWGHASIACIQALGALFTRCGWEFQPSSRHDIEDLPLHVFNRDGESVFYPPSEAFLTDRALSAVVRHGVTALVSIRDRDAVRINGLRSLAGSDLAGPWSAAN